MRKTSLYLLVGCLLLHLAAIARAEEAAIELLARDPAGHGVLCRCQNKTVLIVAGTAEQMGIAHGTLLRDSARKVAERVLHAPEEGEIADFLNNMAEIERRTLPHIPPRFRAECDAMSQSLGISRRDGRYLNLFPEQFHCSGVALRGKATAGGKVLHARVLDYGSASGIQSAAVVTVFMPDHRNTWMSLGYAGLIGTVTAMNEKGLAVGEIGGGGQGNWDGVPMTLLLRDVMERAATVDEAVKIVRDSPRTCEYEYVLSDKSGAMRALYCVPRQVVELQPGQQHPELPRVPEDAVLISSGEAAKVLSKRVQEHYGKIDVPRLIEIIKRPVALKSNLHDAIFAPETLEMWCAYAGKDTLACDEPYARMDLNQLIRFYRTASKP